MTIAGAVAADSAHRQTKDRTSRISASRGCASARLSADHPARTKPNWTQSPLSTRHKAKSGLLLGLAFFLGLAGGGLLLPGRLGRGRDDLEAGRIVLDAHLDLAAI